MDWASNSGAAKDAERAAAKIWTSLERELTSVTEDAPKVDPSFFG